MGLRRSQAVTLISGEAIRFLVTLIGRSSIAFPAQWVRGIVMPTAVGGDGLVTWATAGSHRLAIASTGLFFVGGLLLLTRVDMARGMRAAELESK